ncbi:hypothetical protein RRG08_048338 [Elysia crispata]|uniref:Uncharacterized protein n=1 Tax=Elysia crispata TaxID=231223 RepID=A0AAE1CYZ0_9GAST|nr:hypothetical protein RRG08_048338 [Elysia crispata]
MKITNDTGYLSPAVKTNWDSTAKNAISKVVDKMLKTDMKPSFSMIVKEDKEDYTHNAVRSTTIHRNRLVAIMEEKRERIADRRLSASAKARGKQNASLLGGYLSPTVKTNWDSTAKNAISKVVDKMLKTDMKPSFSMIVKEDKEDYTHNAVRSTTIHRNRLVAIMEEKRERIADRRLSASAKARGKQNASLLGGNDERCHWPITCQNRYRGRNEDLAERSKKMESSASENRKARVVGKEASCKAAKLNEEKEETPTKQTNQEESKMTPKRAKHD